MQSSFLCIFLDSHQRVQFLVNHSENIQLHSTGNRVFYYKESNKDYLSVM